MYVRGLVAFPNSEKKEKETFCCVFLKNVLRVSNPNLFYQRKSFSLFRKGNEKVSLTRVSLLSVDVEMFVRS